MKEKIRRARQSLSLAARIILAAAIIAIVIVKYKDLVNIDVRAIIAAAESAAAAVLTILGVYFIKSIVFVIPASMIYVAVGLAFPIWQALLINAAGILIEVTVTWVVGRLLGGDNVEKLISNSKKGQKLLKVKDTTKYPAFFGIRFLPLFPIDFVSLLIGASPMKFLPYLLVSFCGIMPRVVLFTILGDKIYDIIPMKYVIMGAIVIVLGIIIVSIIRYAIKMAKGAPWEYVPVKESRRSVILDTDMGSDCDDAGALAVLLSMMKEEDMQPLGIVNCTSNRCTNGVIRSILDFCGFFSTPVAQTDRKGFFKDKSSYTEIVCEKYTGFSSGMDVQSALDFYHDALKDAQDDSIVIVSIGMLNNISDLINKYPDLVKKKVHALISMAGKFPEGREYNIHCDAEASKNVFDNFPAPIICSGYEIGEKIKTGFENEPANAGHNPVYDCYLFHGCKGRVRESWDLTTVQFAMEGCSDFYKMSERVRINIAEDGSNTIEKDKNSDRYYLKLKAKPDEVKDYLNQRIADWNEV